MNNFKTISLKKKIVLLFNFYNDRDKEFTFGAAAL